MDKLASAKYAEDILNYADLGEISVNEKEKFISTKLCRCISKYI